MGNRIMNKTIKVRFSHGKLVPLEKVEFPEGEELLVTCEVAQAHGKEIQPELEWGGMSESGFAEDWENEKDAAYDNWHQLYHV